MRYNVQQGMPKQNVVSVFHVTHLPNNFIFINPVITDMNQAVLVNIRLSLGLLKINA